MLLLYSRSYVILHFKLKRKIGTYRKLTHPVSFLGASHTNESWWCGRGEKCEWTMEHMKFCPKDWTDPIPIAGSAWSGSCGMSVFAVYSPVSRKPSKSLLDVIWTATKNPKILIFYKLLIFMWKTELNIIQISLSLPNFKITRFSSQLSNYRISSKYGTRC